MSGEQYTQVRRPVSRLAEKVLGWLSWIFLLLLTIITMFIALVSFSSESSIQNLETSLNGNDFIQQILANNGLNTIQFVIWLQNGIWAVIVYFIVCLLISFLALISMNIRILSGFLFLIATIVTLPLVLLFVPLIIPILFLIVAIMMFARKDKVEMISAYYFGGYQGGYHDYGQERTAEPNPEPRTEPNSQYKAQQDTSDVEQPSNQEQQLRRGGYSSEVANKVNSDINSKEEEPQVLSRQAKYNYKSKQQSNDNDENLQNDLADQNFDSQASEEEARRRQEAFEKEQQLQQEAYEEQQRIKQEKAEEAAREKERRKQQPSAVNQRRMNFEERKKITSQSAESSESDEEQNQSSKNMQSEAADTDKEK